MRNETLATVRRNALRALMPPPRLSLSAWIEKEIRLPADVSALPGPIRLYPFQHGIADAMSDPAIERISVVKSARIGYTTLLVGALGSHVVNEPAPVLFVLPTEDDCRQFVVSNVEPTFESSPCLAGALAGVQGGDNRNTLLSRRFPGGSLKVVAAKAPRNLRAHNTRILIIDEADGMEMTSEGSPILLAEKRTMSFPDRKIIIGSTPIYEETSHVLNAYARSDKRIFESAMPGMRRLPRNRMEGYPVAGRRAGTSALVLPFLRFGGRGTAQICDGRGGPLAGDSAACEGACGLSHQCAGVAPCQCRLGEAGGGIHRREGRSGAVDDLRQHRAWRRAGAKMATSWTTRSGGTSDGASNIIWGMPAKGWRRFHRLPSRVDGA